MIEVLGADFVLAAGARGGERTVLLGHALRHAALPVLTVVGYTRVHLRRVGLDRDGLRLARGGAPALRIDHPARLPGDDGDPAAGLGDGGGGQPDHGRAVREGRSAGAVPQGHRPDECGARYRRSRRAVVALGVLLLTFSWPWRPPLVTAYDPLAGSADALLPPLTPGHPWAPTTWGGMCGRSSSTGPASRWQGLLALLSATLLGTAVGRRRHAGGWPDGALMRLAEFFQTLPRLVLALIVVALFGAGVGRLIFVIAILSWPQTARVVRASVLSCARPRSWTPRGGGDGGRGHRGQRDPPNALAPIVVTGSLDVATAILLEAALGFFGLGDPNRVSWGACSTRPSRTCARRGGWPSSLGWRSPSWCCPSTWWGTA